MTLEKKSETALITLLKSNKDLESIGFSHHISDESKDHQIVVSATRGEEVAAPSGVFEIDVMISLRMRLKRWSQTPELFDDAAAKIEAIISQPHLHQYITRGANEFHCYFAEISPSERDPQDGKFYEHKFNLNIEAMPNDFATVDKLYSRTNHTN